MLEDMVQHPGPGGSKVSWTARSDDGLFLNWVGADRAIAYLVGYKAGKDGRFQGYDSPPRVRRLDLVAGKWLPDVPINHGTPAEYDSKSVLGVLTTGEGVIVLTGLARKPAAKAGQDTVAAYNLCLFRVGAETPAWSKQFISEGERPYTGGYLWGIPPPLYASSDLQRLSWMGERLLVCPEALQPVYCLNPDTGSEIWRVERLWEFRRGFIGPSVWSHYISRFGVEDHEPAKKSIDAERKAFDEQYRCALVGGPVSVPLDFKRGTDSHSIFLAAVKGPASGWAGYLSDCLLYELGDDGKPVSMLTLPRVVDGSRSCVREGGVIWKCQNDTFVKIRPSRSTPGVTMGPGGPNRLSDLVWARQVLYQQPKAWFVSGKAGDPAAFGESHAYCLPGGGYVLEKEDTIYRFPIAAVDLSTGIDSTFVLNVPFKGPFPLPTDNMSQQTLGDGTEFNRTDSFHLMAITHLAADGHQLEVTVATETRKSAVRFDPGTALPKAEAAQHRSPGDPMTAARAQAKLVEWKVRNEALESAASETDDAFLKALLEAGAAPKYSSPVGWTALMAAAVYGTAEMVDILIAAGSDLNAADKNCGGQTVLMWAARSGREAKHKVRSLLKAGADPNRASENGYNALMSAAGSGDLEVVECLLAAGLSASYHDHAGETALMAGVRSGGTNVISALIAAGADKNAIDEEGMTALMRAAEGFDSAGAVEALLKAGADPNVKDKKGRTVLQIALESKRSGSEQVVKLLNPVTTAR
jgi:ankyrin repeat protein